MNSKTPSWLKDDHDFVWHPFTPLWDEMQPLPVERAEGAYLYTPEGKKILDAISSWWVNLHGHAHPELAKALHEQAQKLEHVIFAGFTHEPAARLARETVTDFGFEKGKMFFSDNGSTAVEVGLKMALQFFHNKKETRRRIIAFEGAYHGDTFGAMAVCERNEFNEAFLPLLFDVDFIPLPNEENIEKVCRLAEDILKTGEVAAFIYEPLIQGAGGMRMYTPEHLYRLMQLCRKHGTLCIADEVMTGFGRTGKLFASHYLPELPDIAALSKGITGGTMALGATLCGDHIMDAFRSADWLKTFFHGHSYTGNPLTCAVSLKSRELLMSEDCQKRIREISAWHKAFTEEISGHPAVRDVRSLGTVLAVEFQTSEETSYFNKERHKLYEFFLERNVLLRPLGNLVYVMPPYIISEEEIKKVYAVIREALDKQHSG